MALLAVLLLGISHSVTTDELPCPLLNVGLECVAVSRDRALFPEDLPEGTWEVVLRTASESQLERWFGHSGHTYWVQEPVTCEDLRLMEYDVLIRIALRDLMIPVHFLNWMSEGEILALGERLYHGWHYLRDMAYPDAVSAIHQKYLDATEAAGWYLGGNLPPTTTTMVYRALSEVGVGGARALGYHCHRCAILMHEAALIFAELLDELGILPY